MFLWLMVLLFAYLSFYVSAWFLVGFCFFCSLKTFGWYRYNGRPWRKVHYKAMLLYSMAAGREAANCKAVGREFNLRNTLIEFVKLAKENGFLLSQDATKVVDLEFNRVRKFYDRALIKEHIISKIKNKSISNDVAEKFLDAIKSGLSTEDKSLMVRMIIASMIESRYSAADRSEYVYEMFSGNVN